MNLAALTNYEDPKSFGSRMRARRIGPLLALIKKVHQTKGEVRILDVGGKSQYWKSAPEGFLDKHNVSITILNLPCDLAFENSEGFAYVAGDACEMPEYPDNSFDIVHSNSTIEHVGNWNRIKAFASETRRVAPNLFIQTPNFWFPIEPHFIKPFHHWLPKPWRVRMWRCFQMGQRGKAADLDEAMQKLDDEPYLLNIPMFRFLYPDCRILRERLLFLPKSMVAYRMADE
jgi:hypothetical protein